jgi:hypothetical protein
MKWCLPTWAESLVGLLIEDGTGSSLSVVSMARKRFPLLTFLVVDASYSRRFVLAEKFGSAE